MRVIDQEVLWKSRVTKTITDLKNDCEYMHEEILPNALKKVQEGGDLSGLVRWVNDLKKTIAKLENII